MTNHCSRPRISLASLRESDLHECFHERGHRPHQARPNRAEAPDGRAGAIRWARSGALARPRVISVVSWP